jgi:DNA-binding beta-propeller fold protein YncE
VPLAVVAIAVVMLLPSAFAQSLDKLSVSTSGPPGLSAAASRLAGTCTVGDGPQYLAYDPNNHDMYVPNYEVGTITVLNQTCHHVGTISIGGNPWQAAYDPLNHKMYVTNLQGDLYVIKGLKVVDIISGFPQGAYTFGLVWDPSASMMLMTTFVNNMVVGIQNSTIVGSTGVGGTAQGACYDPNSKTILVVVRESTGASDNVTILNASNPLGGPIANATLGAEFEGLAQCAYDPVDHYDYVTNPGSGNVSVLRGNGSVIGSVSIGGDPSGVAWNPTDQRIWVANWVGDSVSLIRGLSVLTTIKSLGDPMGLAYDGVSHNLYVTSNDYSGQHKVYVVYSK